MVSNTHNWDEYAEKVSKRPPETYSIEEWGRLLGTPALPFRPNNEYESNIMHNIIHKLLDNDDVEMMRWGGRFHNPYQRTNTLSWNILEPMYPINGNRMWDGWSNEYRKGEYKFSMRNPNDSRYYTYGEDSYASGPPCPSLDDPHNHWDVVNPPTGSIVYILDRNSLELIYVSHSDWNREHDCYMWSIYSFMVSLTEQHLENAMRGIKIKHDKECYSDQDTLFHHTQMGRNWVNDGNWSAGFIGSQRMLYGMINWPIDTPMI